MPDATRTVPLEPTEEMITAGVTAVMDCYARADDDEYIDKVRRCMSVAAYKAMIAAAPAEPDPAADPRLVREFREADAQTPRTDAVEQAWQKYVDASDQLKEWPTPDADPWTLCRQLERDLAASQERVKELEEWSKRANKCMDEIEARAEKAEQERDALAKEITDQNNCGPVYFYERDYYPLSNFSAFTVRVGGILFDTSEHAYHYSKFPECKGHRHNILASLSAHAAFKYAEAHKADRRPDWDEVKVGIMRGILVAKVDQHEYVRRKLLATGDRLLVENSWRDDFWGWGPNKDGQNMLGKLWMELRAALVSGRDAT